MIHHYVRNGAGLLLAALLLIPSLPSRAAGLAGTSGYASGAQYREIKEGIQRILSELKGYTPSAARQEEFQAAKDVLERALYDLDYGKGYWNQTESAGILLALKTLGAHLAEYRDQQSHQTPPEGVARQRSDYFTGTGSVRLFERSWHPEGEAKAIFVVVHGLKDHSLRYAGLAAELAKAGYATYALDLRGHGRSGGDAQYVNAFADYVADLHVFIQRVQQREPGKRIVLFGHSLGGAIATVYALDNQASLAGLVLSGAALSLPASLNAAKMLLIAGLSKKTPKLPFAPLPGMLFSSDPKVQADVDGADALVRRGKVPVRTMAELFGAVAARILPEAVKLQLPLLVLHGGNDLVTSPSGSRALHDAATSSDKAIRLYPGLLHDIAHEPGNTVAEDIARWMRDRFE